MPGRARRRLARRRRPGCAATLARGWGWARVAVSPWRRRLPRAAPGAATGRSDRQQEPEPDPDRGTGDVVDDVGDVAGPVEAGQRELGQLDADRVRRQAAPGRAARPATPPRQRAATSTSSAPDGTKTHGVEQALAAGEDPEAVGRRAADVPRAGGQPALGRDDARGAVGRDQGDQRRSRPATRQQRRRWPAPRPARAGAAAAPRAARRAAPETHGAEQHHARTPPTGNIAPDATDR